MEISCPVCRRLVSLADDAIDTQVVCPHCDETFLPSAVLTNVGNPRLADCPDCGHTVSRRAISCPSCGAPLESRHPSVAGKLQRPIPIGSAGKHGSRVERRNNTWALTGFILGCCSIPLSFIGILSIAALVCSIVGISTFDEERHTNSWMGPVGAVLGVLGLLAYLAAYGYLR